MSTRVEIRRHNAGHPVLVGRVTFADDWDWTESQIGAIANESGGLDELTSLGEWDGPADYEWTGDEVYEVIA